jgi:hypothetical protein
MLAAIRFGALGRVHARLVLKAASITLLVVGVGVAIRAFRTA